MSIATSLAEGHHRWNGGQSVFTIAGPGEGAFEFQTVTVGLVVKDQPRHWTRYGSLHKRALPLRSGNGWVLPGGIDGWCAWSEPQHFLNVTIEPEVLRSVGLDPAAGFRPVFGEIDPLVAQLASTLHAADGAPRLYRETMVHALAAQIARTTFQTPGEPSFEAPGDPRLRRVADYINDHLGEDMGLDVLAGVAAMSPFHFSRSFKAAFGLAPHAYLVRRRIERARLLLSTTQLPVADIARRVGYADVSRFGAQFKRATGVTPSAVRTS